MIIEIKTTESNFILKGVITKKIIKKEVVVIECDYCKCISEKRKSKDLLERDRHYCSKECYANDPIAKAKKSEYVKKSYTPKLKELRAEHAKQQFIDNPELRIKASDKMKEMRALNPSPSEPTRKKLSLASKEMWQRQNFRDKRKATDATPETKLKRRLVNLGRKQSEEHVKDRSNKVRGQKRNQTQLNKMIEIANKKETKLKKIETMRKNKTNGTSRPEDNLYKYLCNKFGIDNVKRQEKVNCWAIDFYITTTNTYIQFDGIYWHGLDKSFEEVINSKSRHSKRILQTMKTDINQNHYFHQNNLELVRIPENQPFENYI